MRLWIKCGRNYPERSNPGGVRHHSKGHVNRAFIMTANWFIDYSSAAFLFSTAIDYSQPFDFMR